MVSYYLIKSEDFQKVLADIYKQHEQSFFEFIELGQFVNTEQQHSEDSFDTSLKQMFRIDEIVQLKRHKMSSNLYNYAE